MANFEWTPQYIQDYAGELNKVGALFRNAVACLYNTFSYEVSKYWTGKNYNNIAQYINGYYENYERMINNLAVDIPGKIQDVAISFAIDGGGSLDTIAYSVDAPGVDIVTFAKIPETSISADGKITLTQEMARRYFNEDVEPSVPYYTRLMIEFLDMYERKYDEHGAEFEKTEPLKDAKSEIESYKAQIKNDITKIENVIKDNANKELNIIEQVNVETKEKAQKSVSNIGPNSYVDSKLVAAAAAGAGIGSTTKFVSTAAGVNTRKNTQNDLRAAQTNYINKENEYLENRSEYRKKYDEAEEKFRQETGYSVKEYNEMDDKQAFEKENKNAIKDLNDARNRYERKAGEEIVENDERLAKEAEIANQEFSDMEKSVNPDLYEDVYGKDV